MQVEKFDREKPIRINVAPLAVVFFVFTLLVSLSAQAHPELELRLQSATAEIEANPGDPRLLIRRGELHAEHEDWEAALYDFEQALAADPSYVAVEFHRGRVLHAMGILDLAEIALQTFLLNAGGEEGASRTVASAHFILGQLTEARGQWEEASAHYDAGIRLSPKANAGYYIARARSLVNASDFNVELALAGLDERLRRSPGLYTLAEFAVQLELNRNNLGGAAHRIRQLINAYPMLVRWRLRLAALQRALGREQDARRTYLEARAFINALPEPSRSKMHRYGIAAEVERGLTELE